jgi:hypothetical protein
METLRQVAVRRSPREAQTGFSPFQIGFPGHGKATSQERRQGCDDERHAAKNHGQKYVFHVGRPGTRLLRLLIPQ